MMKEFKPMPDINIEDIRARVADGIALTNDFDRLFALYAEANNDRRTLLKLLDSQASGEAKP